MLAGLSGSSLSNVHSFNRNLASRAVETERVQYNFSEMDIDDEFMKIRGYVDALAGFDEAAGVLTLNGDAKFKLELSEGFKDEEETYEALGFVAGEAYARNVIISETTASGSISYSINGAVNIADITDNIWVKCIFKTQYNLNLSSANQNVKVTVSITAYGNGNTLLNSYTKEISGNLGDFL